MAKKSKPAKKAALKKGAVKKATPKKPLKKTVKKAASKKPAAKRPVKKAVKKITTKKPVKKTVKKAAPKRSFAKKTVKKATSKKPAAKKPVKKIVKKSAPKRYSAKKPVKKSVKKVAPVIAVQRTKRVVKITSPEKNIPVKVAAKPLSAAGNKQAAPVQLTIPELIPVVLPAIPALISPDDVVGKAANIETNRQQMMVPGDGLNAAPVAENPATVFDRNVFNKATAKGDPHSGMQISSVPKGAKKPSAKKPLWRK